VIATGLIELDGLLEGGLPCGQLLEISGPASSGKSTLAFGACLSLLQQGKAVAWVDPGGSFWPLAALEARLPLSKLLVLKVRDGMAALRAVMAAASLTLLLADRFASRRLMAVQTGLGALLVMSLAWTGHGATGEGWAGFLHRSSDVIHLLGAGVWIGALLPLSALLLRLPRAGGAAGVRSAAAALARFSRFGVALVAVIALSGLVNSAFLVQPARWHTLVSTEYGRLLLAKVLLFILMLALAAINRFKLAPRLSAAVAGTPHLHTAVRRLRATLVTETALALAILAIVAQLGAVQPPASAP